MNTSSDMKKCKYCKLSNQTPECPVNATSPQDFESRKRGIITKTIFEAIV